MHIAIEGIDGVGKSTAAKRLAERLGFRLIEKPLHFLFDGETSDENYIRIRDQVNSSKNKRYTAWFYGLGNVYLYEKFGNENIITDRHILSNYCWSGAPETDYVFDAIYRTTGAPDFTFLIYASPEAVKERLKKRDPNDADLKKVAHIPVAYDRMQTVLKRYDMPGVVLDTSSMSADEVIDRMVEILKREGLING